MKFVKIDFAVAIMVKQLVEVLQVLHCNLTLQVFRDRLPQFLEVDSACRNGI